MPDVSVEAASDGLLDRLGDGFYDIYAEDEDMTSVVSYPNRCQLWGDSRYRGNCDGRLIKNLILRYRATKVADPMQGSGTSRDVVAGLNKYKNRVSFRASASCQGFWASATGAVTCIKVLIRPGKTCRAGLTLYGYTRRTGTLCSTESARAT